MDKTRILIVEDEVIIAMEIADRLKSMGYDVLKIVANGEMAIKTAVEDKPDLILMDIMIQGDIDGIETAEIIQKRISIPVIYLTANADDATLERAKISHAFGYLIKPFEEKELNTTIEMALYKHQIELKLRESEERFKGLVENSSIGIFRVSLHGKILHANPMFIQLLGYEKMNELIGRGLSEFIIGGNERAEEFISTIKTQGIVKHHVVELRDHNENMIYGNIGGNLILWEDEPLYYDCTLEDITKQKEYELELIKAKEKAEESDRLKTEFLAGMSHEIRTPINTIMSYLSLLNDQLNSEESTFNEIFDAIEVGSLRLTRTIDSILNMAQFQSGTFDVFQSNINIVDEVLKNLFQEFKCTAKQRGLEFHFTNNCKDSVLCGDKYSLSQLFVNLIDNALKYTREGHVAVLVYNDENNAICVDVADTGIGISEEFLPTLFKPFTQEEQGYTRKFDGNGLGLALVKRYCELNNGTIKVRSEKGIGTTFTVKFLQTEEREEKINQNELHNEN